MENTPGLWTYSTLTTNFTFAVDNFGIKLFANDDITHLLDALQENYSITIDPSGSKYHGLTINWNYSEKKVDIFMPNSISKVLERFQHPFPKLPQYSPHKWLASTYGAKFKYFPDATTAPKLENHGITRVQNIAGTFLYISRAVDPTILVALNKFGSKQASPTTDVIKKTKILMDYSATQPDAVVRFHASNVCLHIENDAAYLIQPKERSRDAGHYYLSDTLPPSPIRPTPTPNGPILTKCQTIRTVMTSAAKAEIGAIFLNGQQAVTIRTNLIEMFHPQPPTTIKTGIATYNSILTGNMFRKCSK